MSFLIGLSDTIEMYGGPESSTHSNFIRLGKWKHLDKLANNMNRIRQPKCSVVDCTNQHKCLHVTPAIEDTRSRWIEFIYDGNVPESVGKYLLVCANHFESDCFLNLGIYNAGHSKRLTLKTGSLPTIRRNNEDEGNVSISLYNSGVCFLSTFCVEASDVSMLCEGAGG